jgi:hypothetical protein
MTAANLFQGVYGVTSDLANAGLSVQRTDIRFFDVAAGRVAIEVKVTNLGYQPTTPTFAVFRAAPLGAFVPWQPLATLPVPSLGPGESFVLRTEAGRPAPEPLGWPDRLTPEQLLAEAEALDRIRTEKEEARKRAAQEEARKRADALAARRGPALPFLPPDFADLLGRGNPYWAGNIDVFVGRKSVERHLARALRVYPGRVNMAMFQVGGPRPDAYRFHLVGTGEDWKATLFDCMGQKTLVTDVARQAPLEEGHWVEWPGRRYMTLALRPPQECGRGKVEVHVTRRSDNQEAVVEFSLDPDAAGPGCYAV